MRAGGEAGGAGEAGRGRGDAGDVGGRPRCDGEAGGGVESGDGQGEGASEAKSGGVAGAEAEDQRMQADDRSAERRPVKPTHRTPSHPSSLSCTRCRCSLRTWLWWVVACLSLCSDGAACSCAVQGGWGREGGGDAQANASRAVILSHAAVSLTPAPRRASSPTHVDAPLPHLPAPAPFSHPSLRPALCVLSFTGSASSSDSAESRSSVSAHTPHTTYTSHTVPAPDPPSLPSFPHSDRPDPSSAALCAVCVWMCGALCSVYDEAWVEPQPDQNQRGKQSARERTSR